MSRKPNTIPLGPEPLRRLAPQVDADLAHKPAALLDRARAGYYDPDNPRRFFTITEELITQRGYAHTPAEVDSYILLQDDARLRELAQRTDDGAVRKPWEALTLTEKLALRAHNDLSRRERLRAAQAEEDAKSAQYRDAFQAALQAYKRQMRQLFAGTDEQFERVIWPDLEKEWLQRSMQPPPHRVTQL